MLRSVDIQQVLLQTNSIERVQQTQQQHPDTQQRYFEAELQKERKEFTEKISNTKESEHLTLKEREERKRKQHEESSAENKRDRQREEILEDQVLEGDLGTTVDIKV